MRRFVVIILLAILSTSITSAQTQPDIFLDSYRDCGFTQMVNEPNLQIGAVVLNFETGTGCIENLDRRFNTASVPKLLVAGAYYDWLSQGLVSATTKLSFNERYWMGGRNACLTERDLGRDLTNAELVELMINCSDNAATWMLMDSLGWSRIQNYVDELGLLNVGRVIPYSEVDRMKLSYIDPRWADIPRAPASRFYRRGWTTGLDAYFEDIPQPLSRTQYVEANRQYFAENTTNVLPPRALADYILRLRHDLINGGTQAIVAQRLFTTMLYTQRQYSTQSLPGTVLAGAKNGFDRGMLAEASVLFNDVELRVPSGLIVVFAQYQALDNRNIDLPGPFAQGGLNQIMQGLSPQIMRVLYPDLASAELTPSLNLSTVVLQNQQAIQVCWQPYFESSFDEDAVDDLERCFSGLEQRTSYPVGENAAMGLVLRGLQAQETRLVFVYTAPNGEVYSYQTDRRFQNQTAIYWFHPLEMLGRWQIDIYVNLQRVYTGEVFAQA